MILGVGTRFIASEPRKQNIHLTYKQLNRQSNQLAYSLKKKGVKPETIVAIRADRSIELIIGMVWILKAGGAYLPIDPEYPQERIDYMLADNQIAFEKDIVGFPDAINRCFVPTPITCVGLGTVR